MQARKHAQNRTTPAEVKDRARALRSYGYSFRQIAKQLNCPLATVHYWAAGVQVVLRNGTGWPNRKPWPKPETQAVTWAAAPRWLILK